MSFTFNEVKEINDTQNQKKVERLVMRKSNAKDLDNVVSINPVIEKVRELYQQYKRSEFYPKIIEYLTKEIKYDEEHQDNLCRVYRCWQTDPEDHYFMRLIIADLYPSAENPKIKFQLPFQYYVKSPEESRYCIIDLSNTGNAARNRIINEVSKAVAKRKEKEEEERKKKKAQEKKE